LIGRAALLSAVVLGMAGCGSGGYGDSATQTQAPTTPAERAAVAELKYCFEGAGALTAKPGKTIPDVGEIRAAPSVKDAKHVLVIAWPDAKHVANAYFAASDAAAETAAGELAAKPIAQKGRVLIAADSDARPSSDEALLASDCLL
jgi:hypothetical protein